ncbi:MAG: amino acid ABC transporter permease [Clostridia bacterium]|nr:amino acid ABC transporter permease [Clostridia bacterium]MBP3653599.1 amino acid ABC transporter permease [Clostridia bacterium]
MDWNFIQRFAPMYVRAAGLTLSIGLMGIGLSLVIGLVCCLLRWFRVPVLRQIAGAYIELARNTPLLVQLFFLYFGLPKIGIKLSAGACAIAGLSFLGGAYMAEALRSGLESVEKSQHESGACIGLTHRQVLMYIIFPQAFATAVPAICANVIFLIKETSVLSAVALADLMYVAKDLIGMYYKTDEALLMLVVAYLVILLPVSLVFSWIERRLRHAGSNRSAAEGA